MAPPNLSSLFTFGLDVMSTVLDDVTNVIVAVLGDSASKQSDGQNVEWVQHTGFASVPAPASADGPSCQTVAIRQGDRNVVIASRDARACDRYANLKPGEACMYATDGQARVVVKNDRCVLYTTADNDKDGAAVFLRVGGKNAAGQRVLLEAVAPFATFTIDETGLHIRHASGFRVDGGGIGGLPGPLSVLSSYFNVTASMQKFQAPLVLLGNGPAYSPVCWAAAENPLTTPGVPLTAMGFGAPTGQFTTASVRVSAT